MKEWKLQKDDRNIIKVIKILFENENNINEKSNKDKLFFFRFNI